MRSRWIDFSNGDVTFEEVKRVQIESGFGLFRCITGSVRGDAPTGICRPVGAWGLVGWSPGLQPGLV